MGAGCRPKDPVAEGGPAVSFKVDRSMPGAYIFITERPPFGPRLKFRSLSRKLILQTETGPALNKERDYG